MKQINFIIREFIEAYQKDDNFRSLLSNIYKCTLFIIFGVCLLIFSAWFVLQLGKIYN